MMRKRLAVLAAVLLPLPVAALVTNACDSDPLTGVPPLLDAAIVPPGDAPPSDGTSGDGPMEGSSGDGGSDASGDALPTPTFVAHFDASAGQLPEGLTELDGSVLVSWAPLGQVVAVVDGGAAAFASLGATSQTLTLGLTTSQQYVNAAVAAGGAAPSPKPGIYYASAANPMLQGAAFSATMTFPNGLDYLSGVLYIADSTGTIFRYTGQPPVAWSQDPQLKGNKTACGGGRAAFDIGANGIVHDANNFYVTNTDYGRLLKIPIQADGGAGQAVAITKQDCAITGADGLVIDPKDNTFIIALNVQNKIVRVDSSGNVTTLAEGAPLDFPASLYIDGTGPQRRLLITNAAFLSAQADGGNPMPGVLALPLP